MFVSLDIKKVISLGLYHGWSMAEIQRQAGLSNGAIYGLVHGKNKSVRASTAYKIAKALGVETKEIACIK